MNKVYLVLLTVSAILFLLDAFSTMRTRTSHGSRFAVRLLPLGLFFWVLVPWFQIARNL